MVRWILTVAAALTVATGCSSGERRSAAEPASTEASPASPNVTANEFLPADRDLDDCISALPQPDCGSGSRGGWRQALILLAIIVGLAFIAWRVVRAARRQRRKVIHDT